MKLVLASASPRRLDLLAQIGVVPDAVCASSIDETPHRNELPHALAMRLALSKANALVAEHPLCAVLAADTVVAVGRRVLPKAASKDEVIKCLTLMSGRRHRVITGVAVLVSGQKPRIKLVESIVSFKRLTTGDIAAYAASGEGLGKAGGYAIQGKAAALIDFISGSYSNIVGLPLYETAGMLKAAGYSLP